MFGFLRNLNEDQRKALSDLLNTIAKLFVGGGMVSPFLNQADVTILAAVIAVVAGVVFHIGALYILRTRR